MNKSIAILSVLLMAILLSLQVVWALESSTNSTTNSSKTTQVSTTKSTPTVKETIPGGTKKFMSKQNMRKKNLESQNSNFPYDMSEALTWIRANKISVLDPITKKTRFVNIMSDADLASFLLSPVGLKASGLENSGLSKDNPNRVIVEKSTKIGYGFSSHREDLDKKLLSPGQSGKKELPYYMVSKSTSSDIPQTGNINEEYAWLRNNLQSIYDPFKKKQISVTRTAEEYLRYLLKAPQVRKNLGLPALQDSDFKKSARY
ncbi:MAG: hypothetical protein AABX70_02655 [Nanoarchaeota archaeon]